MKKISFFVLLLIFSTSAYAQHGVLSIKNSTICDLYVVMGAIDPGVTPPNGCGDLVSNSFVVLAGTGKSFNPWYNIAPTPGWVVMTTFDPTTSTTFNGFKLIFILRAVPAHL